MSLLMLVAFNVSCQDADEAVNDVVEEEDAAYLAVNVETILIDCLDASVGSLRFATNKENSTAVVSLDSYDNFSVEIDGALVYVTAKQQNRSLTDPITATLTLRVGEEGNTATKYVEVCQVAEAVAYLVFDPADTLTLSNTALSSQTIEITTNQDASSVNVYLDDTDKFSYTLDSLTLKVTANTANMSIDTLVLPSSFMIISAGDVVNPVSDTIYFNQSAAPEATLEVSATDTIVLEFETGVSDSFTVTTNQEDATISAVLSDTTYFSVAVEGTTVTVTTKTTNDISGGSAYDADITVTVGYAGDALAGYVDNYNTVVVPVSQENYVFEFDLNKTELELSNDISGTGTVTVTTNQDVETISAYVNDTTKFSVSIEDYTVTVTSLTAITDGVALTDTLTVSAGYGLVAGEDPIKVVLTQTAEVTVSTDVTGVALAKTSGVTSSAVTVTTNMPSFTAEVDDKTNFSVAVDATAGTFTVSSLTANSGAQRTATVTVTAGTETTVTVGVVQSGSTVALGDYLDGGIVYYLAADNSYALIFSINQTDAKLSDDSIDVVTGDISTSNGSTQSGDIAVGSAATTTLATLAGDLFETAFPAIYWCASLGDGWCMPARYELLDLLRIMYGSRDASSSSVRTDGVEAADNGLDKLFVDAITNAGGDQFLPDGEQYLSTTFTTASSAKARMYRFLYETSGIATGVHGGANNSATNSRHVRAVKKVTL